MAHNTASSHTALVPAVVLPASTDKTDERRKRKPDPNGPRYYQTEDAANHYVPIDVSTFAPQPIGRRVQWLPHLEGVIWTDDSIRRFPEAFKRFFFMEPSSQTHRLMEHFRKTLVKRGDPECLESNDTYLMYCQQMQREYVTFLHSKGIWNLNYETTGSRGGKSAKRKEGDNSTDDMRESTHETSKEQVSGAKRTKRNAIIEEAEKHDADIHRDAGISISELLT